MKNAAMGNFFIDMPEVDPVYWMGTPYWVENHYRGRFYTVVDMDDEIVTDGTEHKVLKKYLLMIKNRRTI